MFEHERTKKHFLAGNDDFSLQFSIFPLSI